MKKLDIITFQSPYGMAVGIVVAVICKYKDNLITYTHYLCYVKVPYKNCAKKQLFKYVETTVDGSNISGIEITLLVEYATLPDFEDMLDKCYAFKIKQSHI
jgi:hypothetical protein